MQTLQCPKCGTQFEVDEAGYAAIVRQVRDREFEADLKVREKAAEDRVRLAMSAERAECVKRVIEAEAAVKAAETKAQAEILAAKSGFEAQLRAKDEEVAFYRDFKARQSTKMVGESLERWCEDEFDKVRAAAFPDAEFHKDNTVSASGSKGDYIFRDGGLSIMFEMKNESDSAGKKHRNRDFLKELDKDRREKNCEYAVLVTMLEPDSEFYNAGIADLSFEYEKMYAVRPQCFLTIIGILKAQERNVERLRAELAAEKAKVADVAGIEARIDEFKKGFSENSQKSRTWIATALREIDTAIGRLEKAKDALQSADRQAELAGKKADGLTVRKIVTG